MVASGGIVTVKGLVPARSAHGPDRELADWSEPVKVRVIPPAVRAMLSNGGATGAVHW